jgi:hypothetical protein
MVNLNTYLPTVGVDMTGWHLAWASGVSADGSAITGYGFLNGQQRAFLITGLILNPDGDGDGLLDDWETNGVPYTKSNGTQGRYILDSNGDGVSDANPRRRDLFVEIDAMASVPFSETSLALTRAAFANAPGGNPDQTIGITLHTVVDPINIPFDESFSTLQLPLKRQEHFGTSSDRIGNPADVEARLAAKGKAFRYCLFANRMTDGPDRVLGVATGIPSATFAVSLGGLGWSPPEIERYLASTFMHELGHTLGLCHGGNDDRDYKPNYISVMNYNFDELKKYSGGVLSRLPLDYSREVLDTLNESDLNERKGVGGSSLHARVYVPYATKNTSGDRIAKRLIVGAPVDWNNNRTEDEHASVDVTWFPDDHPLAGQSTPGDTLSGFHDWDALIYAVPPLSPIQNRCSGNGRVCRLTEELVLWHCQNIPAPVLACLADFNNDNTVNTPDLTFFLGRFGEPVTPGSPAERADFNADGAVNTADLIFFLGRFGSPCP